MPELPEVEVVRRGLERWVVGRTIASVSVAHPRAIRQHVAGVEDFAGLLVGRRVEAARRRGKYLWLPLGPCDGGAPEYALLAHLGMSGQLLVQPPGTPDEKHLRVRFTFADDGLELRFVDQRTFGRLAVEPLDSAAAPAPDGVPKVIAHIARDPLEAGFDDEEFYAAVRRRRTGIKRALLDQSLISGVGNIYADEALWRAGLHYARPTETLTRTEVTRLLAAVRAVMGEALAAGGTSFDSLYVNVNGESGYFDRSLNVYGRENEPCARCGTPIRRDPFMNRSSYTCPRCQPRPRRARW
ncbi:formamidopyrimidine-DNA glycosylase [Carbonactinospora thermoautotrophica]|uniref:Formamidopyrimidine-DNA glycosylase n=1 Tax=Carbonactinospora thermoautotrophica TaxID=1469144 RepID=A0A132NG29_9ACTN|nr:bifunctional DNA-formamidopyrimidine glycosylase/DNA-(apurinic or apyrimidinic site) lyase [Carbonactinospora thermoautotrophica]KWW99650.1 Formamidopyrimidine-DNA glycosylase [Carbonactinospora thermoautotrophica]KWX03981.1 formamidopyrimidine-DNA glycosylase [Carbonactinospora thermoautotrophica]KWX09029.1 formamidopyrimidine-DNA glycosylase [Carbonactinospora thermoautotrophica]